MSTFYLDIIKDRLYTSKPNATKRRAAQTVMYEILTVLVKILAPMTAFTAEEIWGFMPHTSFEKVESVMLTKWPETNPKYDDKQLEEKWNKILELKEKVAKELELARAEKVIGHSLNAKVTLYADGENYEFLKENEEILMTCFIVSGIEIVKNSRKAEEENIGIKVEVAKGEKCERCWMYSETVGQDKENPTICARCSKELKE